MIATLPPAHPLFPAHQVFLWLPGLPGDHIPYCTYNATPELRGDYWTDQEERHDANMASYSPPYPVSSETYIGWHTNVSPPFPFHPIPLVRSISNREMEDLARRVMKRLDLKSEANSRPLSVLRNDRKCFVLSALAEMGLLSKTDHQRK